MVQMEDVYICVNVQIWSDIYVGVRSVGVTSVYRCISREPFALPLWSWTITMQLQPVLRAGTSQKNIASQKIMFH
jgi:hypothetical protein